MTPSLYTAEDVAKLFAVSKATIYDLARNNEIPHVRFGRTVRFEPSSLDEWIKAQTRSA